MSARDDCDLCVIGAGSGGLTVASGAAGMGARVVLIERAELGGDCLNRGCVPSKALIAAAAKAQAMRSGAPFGITPVEPEIDFSALRAHVRATIDAIAPVDSIARYRGMGVDVIPDHGRFVAPDAVSAGGRIIRARRFVVAAGSRPSLPPIPGLDTVPALTSDTIFDLDRKPDHLVVLGAGPIGLELAQAYRRLGVAVTVIDKDRALPREDPELARLLTRVLRHEGVRLIERAMVTNVAADGSGIRVDLGPGAAPVSGSHLLVATGRRANVEDLGLEAAGIATHPGGIVVDHGLRTTNRRVYAVGDITGAPAFTHVAGYHGGLVLRSALFRLPVRADLNAVPRATFTDPELAAVGLSETEAEARGPIRVLRWPVAENDRAVATRERDGLIKVIVDPKGRILGAAILGPGAGDLIQPWALALSRGLKIGAMATGVVAYPTLSEISKRAAGAYYAPALFGPGIRRLVRLIGLLPG